MADLKSIRRIDQVAIRDAIERHLFDAPTRESRRRIKRLDPPILSTYQLRVDDFRVLYDVDEGQTTVVIVAVRFKGRMTLEEAAHGDNN